MKIIPLEEQVVSSVFLGENVVVEEGAVIGYKPSRRLADLTLRLGNHSYIRTGTILYAGSTLGNHLETGHHVLIREENILGDDVQIWSNSIIDYGCRLGSRIKIHCNVYICQASVIEDDVFLGPGVSLANDKYPVRSTGWEGPQIKRGARIGMNTTLLPGVVIGENAMIGAGSVVTHDIPPHTLAYGVPAQVHGAWKGEKI